MKTFDNVHNEINKRITHVNYSGRVSQILFLYMILMGKDTVHFQPHKILGPNNLSKSCQVDKFLTSLTRHHAGDEKDTGTTLTTLKLSIDDNLMSTRMTTFRFV